MLSLPDPDSPQQMCTLIGGCFQGAKGHAFTGCAHHKGGFVPRVVARLMWAGDM